MQILRAAAALALLLIPASALPVAGAPAGAPAVTDGNKGLPSGQQEDHHPQAVPSPKGQHAPAVELAPGTEAPPFMLPPINAAQCGVKGMLSLNQYKNRDDATRPKAYLLTFFASWCEPCKKELPQLQALYLKNAARGLMIIDVSIDTDERSYTALAELLEANAVTFPVVWDKYAVMGKRYKVSRLPYVILLDGDGRVVKSMVGYDEGAFGRLIADTEALLSGGAPAPAAALPQETPAAQPAAPVSPYGTPPEWTKK